MEISSYVTNAISSISHINSHRDFEVATQLKDSAAKAENEQDRQVLETIGGILTMSYNSNDHTFSPLIVWYSGSRSFSMEDLSQDDVEILVTVANISESIWIRTRLYHVAWVLSKNGQYGQFAVAGYLELFDSSFEPSQWTKCNDAIQCAFYIASMLGKKSESFKQTRVAINQKLNVMDGTDPLFLSLSLIELAIMDASAKELEEYFRIVSKLVDKNICVGNTNTHLADNTFSVQETLLKRLKKKDDIKAATIKYASYYEEMSESLAKENNYHNAVIMLKKSCTLYSICDRGKLLALRIRLEELQEKTLQSMQAFSHKFNAEPICKFVEQLYDGLSLQETIIQLGRTATIYKVEDVKQQVVKKQKESIFSSMFGSSMLNESGQTVQELPPLNEVVADTNSEMFHKYMVRHVSKQRGQMETITLGYAFGYLRKFGFFSEAALDFLVDDNAIIPENRTEIIKEGLYWGLTGKLYVAMHILLPQTEHIFRNLVKMCGDTVTFLKEDGTETYKPLSALFKSEKLLECYDEDIIFTFQSIMDEPIGENLRNLNAHGLLEPQIGNSTSALCFVCLLIKLLAMYSPKARPMLKKLSKKDSSTN